MNPADELLAWSLRHRRARVASRRPSRPRGRLPRPKVPRGAEMAYERALLAISRKLATEVDRTMRPHLERAARAEQGVREDAEIDVGELARDFGNLRIRFGQILTIRELWPILDRVGKRIAKDNAREISRLLRIDIREETPAVIELLNTWRRANVDLITSIGDRLLGDVYKVVTEAATKGTRVETLSKLIRDRYRVSDSRAKLIARDQVLKANSDLTRQRHEDAGVKRYVWSTSKDERVRGRPGGKWPEGMHHQLEGQVFSWDDPPVTNKQGDRNHPGQDYQCRCVAIPVLDDDE